MERTSCSCSIETGNSLNEILIVLRQKSSRLNKVSIPCKRLIKVLLINYQIIESCFSPLSDSV